MVVLAQNMCRMSRNRMREASGKNRGTECTFFEWLHSRNCRVLFRFCTHPINATVLGFTANAKNCVTEKALLRQPFPRVSTSFGSHKIGYWRAFSLCRGFPRGCFPREHLPESVEGCPHIDLEKLEEDTFGTTSSSVNMHEARRDIENEIFSLMCASFSRRRPDSISSCLSTWA